ncbi:hypothetical protein [Bartonella sp. AD13SXNS]|uniref:hypothetical protein n=1 Tax=Bartonella sp. AD13SXNS TaxID=3243462 RepID=UPI0035D0F717
MVSFINKPWCFEWHWAFQRFYGVFNGFFPVIVGDCGQLILVWRWWMALGWPLFMVSFF